MNDNDFLELINTLKSDSGEFLTDNINFRANDNSFDLHRIFKLPYTVDASTGLLVKEKLEQLNFNDIILEKH